MLHDRRHRGPASTALEKPGPSGVVTSSAANESSSSVEVKTEESATNGTGETDDNPFSALAAGPVKIEPAGQDGLRKRNVDTEPRED